MASMWRRAMLYLGLGPDEDYDDYDAADHQGGAQRPAAAPARYGVAQPALDSGEADTAASPVRTLSPSAVRPQTAPPAGDPGARPRSAAVRPIQPAAAAKPRVVAPRSFNSAQEVADTFKGATPVIINLQGVERDISRRIIDFTSGLCYGLGGQMERVANQVYLVTPLNVEVSEEERRRLEERGYEG